MQRGARAGHGRLIRGRGAARRHDVMAEQGEHGGMAADPVGDAEEHDPAVLGIVHRGESDHVAVERDHRVKIDAADGDRAKGADGESSF